MSVGRPSTISWVIVALFLWCSCFWNGVLSTTLTIRNNCGQTVWPGLLSNAGLAGISNGGFALGAGQSTDVSLPRAWSGRMWGRTGCKFGAGGAGVCASGDCGGKLECSGAGAEPPVTLVEITLQQPPQQDFYDVSLVDGYNLPVAVRPLHSSNGTCATAGCSHDLNGRCPAELQVLDTSRNVIACKSACLAFQTPEYCCSGAYATPDACKPSSYSKLFKASCPSAYSYAYDDPTSIFTCTGADDYVVTFCPPSSSSGAAASSTSVWWRRLVFGCAVVGLLFHPLS